jgi:multiple sugar transport system ATP-binding protein
MSADLRIEELTVQYKRHRSALGTWLNRRQKGDSDDLQPKALDNVSLEVAAGQVATILGPSGCGKTTLLRVIAGLIKMHEASVYGKIYVGGTNITYTRPADRHMAMVPQSLNLYPHYSVARNLEFPLRMRYVSPEIRKRRIAEVAELLGIGHLLGRKPKELSGGEQQRLALGRMIIRDDTIIELYDEPFSSLDIVLRRKLRRVLRDLHSQFGRTTLFVTHDPEEASFLSNIIIIMRGGRIEQMGTYHDLLTVPKNLFVGRLIRSDEFNTISVNVRYKEHFILEKGVFRFCLSPLLAEKLRRISRDELVLGLDVHTVELTCSGAADASNTVQGELVSVSLSDGRKKVEMQVGSELFEFTLYDTELLRVGDQVSLRVRDEGVYFFDSETGERI